MSVNTAYVASGGEKKCGGTVFTGHDSRGHVAKFDTTGGRYVRALPEGEVRTDSEGFPVVQIAALMPYERALFYVGYILLAFFSALTIYSCFWFYEECERFFVSLFPYAHDMDGGTVLHLMSFRRTLVHERVKRIGVPRILNIIAVAMVLFVVWTPRSIDPRAHKRWPWFTMVFSGFLRVAMAQLMGVVSVKVQVVAGVAMLVPLMMSWHFYLLRTAVSQAGYAGYYIMMVSLMMSAVSPLSLWMQDNVLLGMYLALVYMRAGGGESKVHDAAASGPLTELQQRWERVMKIPMGGVSDEVIRQVTATTPVGERSSGHLSRQWAVYGDKLIGQVIALVAVLNRWDVGATSRVVQTFASNAMLARYVRQEASALLSADTLLLSEGALGTVFEALVGLSWYHNHSRCGDTLYRDLMLNHVPRASQHVVSRSDGAITAVGEQSGV